MIGGTRSDLKTQENGVSVHTLFSLLGIGYAMSLLGPAIGYVLGGQLLQVYIDVNMPKRQDIT